jgi:hypothetical protein
LAPGRAVNLDLFEFVERFAPISEALLVHCLDTFMSDRIAEGVLRSSRAILALPNGLETSTELNIVALISFLDSHPSDNDALVAVLKLFCRHNQEFDDVLKDEMQVLLGRGTECPHVLLLKMQLEELGPAEMIAAYKEGMARLSDGSRTGALLFPFFEKMQIAPLDLTLEVFAISFLSSKCEKEIFRAGLKEMSEDVAAGFRQSFSRSVNPLKPRAIDFKRVYFLVKALPHLREMILKRVGLSKERGMALTHFSEDVKHYVTKILDL